MIKIIWFILIMGIIFRVFITSNDNFIFNMDNARDMIDVREMVTLGNIRLIGPTTSIDGVYFGPFWYYLLAIPFLLTGGNPYGSIILEIALWAVGGYFLLTLVNKYYSKWGFTGVAFLWLASNFIILGTQYAFNPNPVLFLIPVFIFSLLKYIETEKIKYSILTWFLAGSFFHFIIPVGVFMPIIIILAVGILKKKLLTKKSLFFGLIAFFVTFIPQMIFELRHNLFMTKNLFSYNSTSHGSLNQLIHMRALSILKSFYDTLLPTFMNLKLFTISMIVLLFSILLKNIKEKRIDNLTLVCLLLIFVPLIGLIPLKVDIMRWYLNAEMVAAIILVGFIISSLEKTKLGKILAFGILVYLAIFTILNISTYIKATGVGLVGNSILKEELKAIDFVYQEADGKNFKVYTYLPSVYDWPYQYLFWWYGQNRYGFLPEEYAYSPGKPAYVGDKEKFNTGTKPESSGLIFLIKEADQIGQRHLWENQFKDLILLQTDQVGSVVIETRKANLRQ